MAQQQPTPPALVGTRPQLRIDGEPQQALTTGLLRLEVRQSLAEPATATLTFPQTFPPGEDPLAVLAPGRRLSILMVGEDLQPLFLGTIDGLSYRYEPDAPPELIVTASDDLARLDGSRRSRVFANMTDFQVLTALADLHSLGMNIAVEGFFPTPETIVQSEQTDLAFLYERARRARAFCYVAEGVIQVRRPETALDGPTLTYGADLVRVTLTTSLRGQPTETRVVGWSLTDASPIGEVATGAVLGEEADGLVTANDLLASLGAVRPDLVAASVPLTEAEAQWLAATYYLEAARRYVTGRGEAAGNAALHAGSHVTLAGLTPALNGRYFVPVAVHHFDAARGYVTRFDVQRAGLTEV